MSSDVGLVVASGAVAVASSLTTAYVLRLSAVGADVRRHDRRARALDEDLERWVLDDHRRLQDEIRGITERHNARNTLHSGMVLADVADAKTQALQRFRDRQAESDRALADMLAEESWLHELYRRWKRHGPLLLYAHERVQPILDHWRSASTVSGMEDQAAVYDPTRAKLEAVIAQLRSAAPSTPDGDRPPVEAPPQLGYESSDL